MKDCSLKNLSLYFMKLGSIGFGGPAALVHYMEKDLVEERAWISQEEYNEGFTLAQLAPGPLAAQLAIYLGWVRYKNIGATLCGLAFILPSFLMCLVLAWLYIQFQNLPWVQPIFYTVGACVIGIIIMSSYKLAKKAIAKEKMLFIIWAFSAVLTAVYESEEVWFFILSGLVFMLWKNPNLFQKKSLGITLMPFLFTGINGPADTTTAFNILKFFTIAGSFVFGSGLAIVPFLHGGVVNEYQWLTEKQFLDAVAIAMITPGPVVITVAFIGYLVAGFSGAILAGIGTFLPCYLFTIIPAPHFHKYAKNIYLKSFILGVTAAAIGAIAGASWVLGKRAVVDATTLIVCVISLGLLLKTKIKEPLLILISGVLGLLIYLYRP